MSFLLKLCYENVRYFRTPFRELWTGIREYHRVNSNFKAGFFLDKPIIMEFSDKRLGSYRSVRNDDSLPLKYPFQPVIRQLDQN